MASTEEKEAEDVTPCGFERRGEALGEAGCVRKATNANDGSNDYNHNEREEATKTAGGEKEKVRFDLSSG